MLAGAESFALVVPFARGCPWEGVELHVKVPVSDTSWRDRRAFRGQEKLSDTQHDARCIRPTVVVTVRLCRLLLLLVP